MILIGNDIIDLECKYNRASLENPRYLNKILTKKEQDYCRINQQFYLAYIFWTCKESAYKVFLKKGLKKSFSPKKYEVEIHNILLNEVHSVVSYENIFCHTISTVHPEKYVHTIGLNSQSKHKFRFCNLVAKREEDLLPDIANKLNVNLKQLSIQKINGIPYITNNGKQTSWDLSISHDGRFHSYAMVHSKKTNDR